MRSSTWSLRVSRPAVVLAAALLLAAVPPALGQFIPQSSTASLWTVNGSPAVPIGTNPNWTAFSNVQWMGPVANSHINNIGVGAFTYTALFDLTNHQRLTFRADVQTLVDDQLAVVRINGTSIPFTSNGFNSPGTFQVLGSSGLLLPGLNTISITVNNQIVSPTGLAVRNAFTTVAPLPPFSPAPSPFQTRNVINLPEGNGLSTEQFIGLGQPPNWRLASVAPNTAAVTGGNAQGGTFSFDVFNNDFIGVRGANAVRGTSFVVAGPVNTTSALIADPAYTRAAPLGNFAVQVNVFNVAPVLAPLEANGLDLSNLPKREIIRYQISAFDPGAIPLDIVADGINFTGVPRSPDGQTRVNLQRSYNRSGQYQIPISVSDGIATTSTTVTVTVRNSAPEIRQLQLLDGQSTTELFSGDVIELTPSTPYILRTSIADADRDSLTTTWTIGSEVVLQTNFTISQITLTPSPNRLDYPVTLTITDNDAPPVVRSFLLTTRPQVIPEPATALLPLCLFPLLHRRRR